MASIKEYLDQIRLAIYGEEVRGSIINAISAINNESSSASQSASQSAASSRESANSAAQTAQMVGKYDRMTVSVTELLPSQAPTVEMTEDATKKHLSFGIPQGEQGLKGDKGDTGDTGPIGPQGIQGLKGDKGDTGDTGPVGPQGIQGEQGIQGDPGPTPQITVNVETGAPGTQASVVQTGTAEAPVLTFTIPKGDTGAVDGLPLGNTPAKPLGSNASAGVSEEASRLDHIHPIPSADDLSVVSYLEQDLTDDQKAQARTNINSVSQPNDDTGTTDQPETLNAQMLAGMTLTGMTLTSIKEMLEPVGTIFQWLPVSGSALDLSTPEKVSAYKGFGTWRQIKDRFLLASGDAYAAGSLGGEATHTLTVSEIPSHNHTVNGGLELTSINTNSLAMSGEMASQYRLTGSEGGNQPHNNMPPYLAVYIWQRIA